MNRRIFARTLATTAMGAYGFTRWPGMLSEESKTESHKAADSGAPFDVSVMLWTVFTDLPFEKRLEKIAEAGYRNVELVAEYDKWTEDDFKRAVAKHKELGINFDCTAGLKHGVCNPDHRQPLVAELRAALPIMDRLDCPSMILLSGNRVPGLSAEAQHQSCIESLKAAASVVEGNSIAGKPVRLFLETIDPPENPQCYLTTMNEALQIVQAVNHPQVQLLYDFYHEQIAAGNLITTLEKCIPHLGLVHIADVPGRHQPGTGEINYPNIFKKLSELGYDGMVAMEFKPTGDPVTRLREAREMALRAGASLTSAARV